MSNVLTGPGIAEYAGITYRQLEHWSNQGYLRAEAPAPGAGVAHYYGPDEAPVAKWMALLVRHGITPAAAAPIARDLHHHGRARLGLFDITTATIPTGATA